MLCATTHITFLIFRLSMKHVYLPLDLVLVIFISYIKYKKYEKKNRIYDSVNSSIFQNILMFKKYDR